MLMEHISESFLDKLGSDFSVGNILNALFFSSRFLNVKICLELDGNEEEQKTFKCSDWDKKIQDAKNEFNDFWDVFKEFDQGTRAARIDRLGRDYWLIQICKDLEFYFGDYTHTRTTEDKRNSYKTILKNINALLYEDLIIEDSIIIECEGFASDDPNEKLIFNCMMGIKMIKEYIENKLFSEMVDCQNDYDELYALFGEIFQLASLTMHKCIDFYLEYRNRFGTYKSIFNDIIDTLGKNPQMNKMEAFKMYLPKLKTYLDEAGKS